MKKITVNITVLFDMSKFSDDMITSREIVKEIVIKQMIEAFSWDEGYSGVKVEVIDTE